MRFLAVLAVLHVQVKLELTIILAATSFPGKVPWTWWKFPGCNSLVTLYIPHRNIRYYNF